MPRTPHMSDQNNNGHLGVLAHVSHELRTPMTGIIGREAAYSGKEVAWDEAMQSTARLGPEKLQFGDYPIPPVAMPGTYKPA